MDFPFSEKKVGGKLFLREFKGDVNSEELDFGIRIRKIEG